MNIKLEQTKDHRTYDIKFGDIFVDCEINNNNASEFALDTSCSIDHLNATQLRLIADKLDELNGESK